MAASRPAGGAPAVAAGSPKPPARTAVGSKRYALISAKFKVLLSTFGAGLQKTGQAPKCVDFSYGWIYACIWPERYKVGPGPGKYSRQPCTGIKDHDFTKYAEPAYSMRVRSKERLIATVESPGPCYFVDPSVSHVGIWKPVSFRIPQERKSSRTLPTPAPNKYYVERIHPLEEPNAPAYTIGTRTRYWESNPYPAPNSYTLPGTLGPGLPVKASAPCLSMASSASVWSYAKDLVRGPGPAMYTIPEPDVYLHQQPAYSISQRFSPSSKDYTPGPPDYNAEQVTAHKPQAPRFSLGIRHSEYAHGTPPTCIVKE